MVSSKKLGLSLSGGGYRAAAFHLGTLKKLHELHILEKTDVLSTISGGSITGACYCLNKEGFSAFENRMTGLLTSKNVIRQVFISFSFLKTLLLFILFMGAATVLLFSSIPWASFLVIGLLIFLVFRYQFAILPVSREIEKAYKKFFFGDAVLSGLNERPVLAIGSTNLQTARPFTFSKERMEDSAYAFMSPPILFDQREFPVARAVLASSCVPFAFTPISIAKEYFLNPADAERLNPRLVDGGVYDNQGIQKITQPGSSYECDIIITSDAGNKLPFAGFYNNTIILLIRTVDVFMARIRNFQMTQDIYSNAGGPSREIAYFSLGWDLKNCIPGFISNLAENKIIASVIWTHHIPEEWLEDINWHRNEIQKLLESNVGYNAIAERDLSDEDLAVARTVGTNLTPLSKRQVDCLIRHAENLAELQVKLYCPSLFEQKKDIN